MKPLAARMRPLSFDDLIGQDDIAREDSPLRKAAKEGNPLSAIFWGPPGSGKTTLALLLAKEYNLPLRQLSATTDGVAALRKIIKESEEERVLLFIDEIHRWNKAQQDALLSFVEEGSIVLLGATTENPGHYINRALLSRAKLFRLQPLEEKDIKTLLTRALRDFYPDSSLSEESLDLLARAAEGDARRALGYLEGALSAPGEVSLEAVRESIGEALGSSRGDEHYHLISAFIKSMRASNPDAALYWLARMEESGEDPRFIARRMVIFASEDIGLARSGAASIAESIAASTERIDPPECWIILSHGAAYLSNAPKSRQSYDAWRFFQQEVRRSRKPPVPAHLRQGNSVTRQFGEGYNIKSTEGFLPENQQGFFGRDEK